MDIVPGAPHASVVAVSRFPMQVVFLRSVSHCVRNSSGACSEKSSGATQNLVDVSDIFYFFCLGEGKGESEAPGRWRGGRVFVENARRGGAPSRRGREGVCGEFRGGGPKYFFRGRNSHQENQG